MCVSVCVCVCVCVRVPNAHACHACIFLLGILIVKGVTARRLYKSFGFKGFIKILLLPRRICWLLYNDTTYKDAWSSYQNNLMCVVVDIWTDMLHEHKINTPWSLVGGNEACPSLHLAVPKYLAAVPATPWCVVTSRRCRISTNIQTNKQKKPNRRFVPDTHI
jgi:hypothetical protein